MASNTVTLKFLGDTRDIEKSFRVVQGGADETTSKFSKFAAKVKPLAAAAGGAIAVHFGRASVDAFKEAEQAQNRLTEAFRKFPNVADVNIGSLRKLNEQLAKKTRFDDDATASGQAVLAQFKLTGTQLQAITPLLQDYAAKTGKDLPTAANDLGKALLGQGRALKAIGLDFNDTGSVAGNFEQIMSGLRTQVGGFAESEGKTAAGQAEILKNRFGELQEKVGAALLPVLQQLADKLIAMLDWFQALDPKIQAVIASLGVLALVAGPLTSVVNGLSGAVKGLGVAMTWLAGSPLLAAIAAGAALGVVLHNLIERHFPGVNRALEEFGGDLYDVANGAISTINAGIRTFISWIDRALDKVSELGKALRKIPGASTVAKSGANLVIPGLGNLIPGLASGGIVTRPTLAMIGEGNGPEAVIPLNRAGGLGTTYVTVNMPPGSDGEDVVRAIRRWERRNGPLY